MLMRTMQRCLVVPAVALGACASPRAGHDAVPVPKSPAVACAPDTALPKELQEPGSAVLFGEIHGTQELPAFFGEAVCTAASTGLPIEVGFEMPAADQATVDAFLASPGGDADVEALLSAPWWSPAFPDGRSSQSRVVLLQRLRQLRSRGLPLRLFLFDPNSAKDMGARDTMMAETVAAHLRAHPEALTMILVGNVHAATTKGSPWDPDYMPMGFQLGEAGIRVRSLNRSTPAGTAWTCTGKSMADMKCESSPARASAPLPSGRTTGIELLPEPTREGFVGLYATPSLTSSPPAKPPQATQG
jgi:hypothetical protein